MVTQPALCPLHTHFPSVFCMKLRIIHTMLCKYLYRLCPKQRTHTHNNRRYCDVVSAGHCGSPLFFFLLIVSLKNVCWCTTADDAHKLLAADDVRRRVEQRRWIIDTHSLARVEIVNNLTLTSRSVHVNPHRVLSLSLFPVTLVSACSGAALCSCPRGLPCRLLEANWQEDW